MFTRNFLEEDEKLRNSSIDVPMINIEGVNWPDIKYYGYDHHKSCAYLSRHIGTTLNLKQRDLDVLWLSSLFHDLGRVDGGKQENKDHDIRSADIAERILKGDSNFFHDEDLIKNVTKLIANHSNIKDENLKDSPVFRCLHDSDVLESARFNINTPEGMEVILSRYSYDVMMTDFGKNKANLKMWMKHRGWK